MSSFSNNAVEIPIKVIGSHNDGGQLIYVIQFRDGVKLVESEVANEMYPQIVIKYYEEILELAL